MYVGFVPGQTYRGPPPRARLEGGWLGVFAQEITQYREDDMH